jgi:hypothetical protein
MGAFAKSKVVPLGAIAIPSISDGTIKSEIGIAASFLLLAWIAVALRFYTRAFVVRNLGWDDWIMALTLVKLTFCSIFEPD